MPLLPLVATVALVQLAPASDTRPVARPDTEASAPAPDVSSDSPPRAEAPAPFTADSIVVDKSERRLSLFSHGAVVRTYLVALGQQPVGDKVKQGDMRTPEGLFHIEARNPESRYHLALKISYPDAAHRARARALGVSPGGAIMIHGLPARYAAVGPAHRDFDWTEGCIAVTNEEIEEIWSAVPVGTPVHIKP
jgi:murein L,D-transpeptidase YafK